MLLLLTEINLKKFDILYHRLLSYFNANKIIKTWVKFLTLYKQFLFNFGCHQENNEYKNSKINLKVGTPASYFNVRKIKWRNSIYTEKKIECKYVIWKHIWKNSVLSCIKKIFVWFETYTLSIYIYR